MILQNSLDINLKNIISIKTPGNNNEATKNNQNNNSRYLDNCYSFNILYAYK